MDSTSAPLVVLFERDDSIAIPLLSLLRRSGNSVKYQVRSARTPIEMFDIMRKEPVTLVLINLGIGTAGRREFWVALDAYRRGSALQVLTFRIQAPVRDLELDPVSPPMRAIADVEIEGAWEYEKLVDAVQQHLGTRGAQPGTASISPFDEVPMLPNMHHRSLVGITQTTVFISYSRKDGAFAKRLVSDLRTTGINVWLDHDRLTPGTADWEREIRRAITASTGVILLASEDATASEYVRDELAIARDNNITVYPLWVRGTTWSSCIPLGWGRVQYVDARGAKYASGLRHIVAQLTKAGSDSDP